MLNYMHFMTRGWWEDCGEDTKDYYNSFMSRRDIGLDNCVRQKIGFVVGLVEQSGRNILDVGCGPGIGYCSLAMRLGERFKYLGIDITSEFLDAARNRAALFGYNNWRFKRVDIFDLPSGELQSGCYNIIVCKDVLEHLPPVGYDQEYNWKVALTNLIKMSPQNLILGFFLGLRREKTTYAISNGFYEHFFAECDVMSAFREMLIPRRDIWVFHTKTFGNRTAALLWWRKRDEVDSNSSGGLLEGNYEL